MTITYRPNTDGTRIAVRLGGKTVGYINKTLGGMWHYAPIGSKGYGSAFKTLAECKRSLESA